MRQYFAGARLELGINPERYRAYEIMEMIERDFINNEVSSYRPKCYLSIDLLDISVRVVHNTAHYLLLYMLYDIITYDLNNTVKVTLYRDIE